jgi:ribosome-associated protein
MQKFNIKTAMLERPKAKKKDITAMDPADLRKLVFEVAKLAEDKKAIDTEILDITQVADIADYVIITSASSPAQLKAISRYIEETLSEREMEPTHKEGKYGTKWYLLDYLDFVVHIIDESAREFYNLEELWKEAVFIPRDEWS